MKYEDEHERIVKICQTAVTLTEVETRLNLSSPNSSLRRYIKIKKISLPLYEGASAFFKRNSFSDKATIDDLCINSKRCTGTIKKFLLKNKIKEKKCEKCGWCEKRQSDGRIPIELHHINGVNNDNRIENLQILCPNCHSLSDNFAGKNKINNSRRSKFKERLRYYSNKSPNICKECKKICHTKYFCSKECRRLFFKYPNKEELQNLINNYSFVAIGKMYKVSDNAVRKWAKKYNLI